MSETEQPVDYRLLLERYMLFVMVEDGTTYVEELTGDLRYDFSSAEILALDRIEGRVRARALR